MEDSADASCSAVFMDRYLGRLRTMYPPWTFSILRPSSSGDPEVSSGFWRISSATRVSLSGTLDVLASACSVVRTNPSFVAVTRSVIQTSRVAKSSSHMDELTMVPNSLTNMVVVSCQVDGL